ncbi:MAG: hypothetical protein EOP93_20110 [Lysobacteraceae bacterium]|nr:MAG: hypothetical protein EOP93_20110 [Xanthomonadaceae bacterium]
MTPIAQPRSLPPPGSVHVLLLGATLALFLGALLGDLAYWKTFEIQWNNFASWLIVGGLVAGALALVCALPGLAPARRTTNATMHFVLLLATWVVGFFNALMHARDAWASMPGGLVMSVVVFVLGCDATWFGIRAARTGGVK